MASEYILKLKAQLDTSEVQSQLGKLGNGNSSGSSGNGGSSAGNNNFNGLKVTLDRLNKSIIDLNKSISRISTNSNNNGINRFGKSQWIPNISSSLPIASGSTGSSKILGATGDLFHQKALSDFLQKNLNMPNRQFRKLVQSEVDRGSRIGKMWQQMFPTNTADEANMFKRTRGADYIQEVQGISKSLKEKAAGKPFLDKRMGGMMLGYATRDILGGAADVADATGHSTTARVLGNVGTVASYAGMGAMAGGPIGAAIGGVVGGLKVLTDEWARSARELKEVNDQVDGILRTLQDTVNGYNDSKDQRSLSRAVKKYDVKAIELLRNNNSKELAAERNSNYASQVDREGGIKDYIQNTRIKFQKNHDKEEYDARKKVIEGYQRHIKNLQRLEKSHNDYSDALEDLAERHKELRKSIKLSDASDEVDKMSSGDVAANYEYYKKGLDNAKARRTELKNKGASLADLEKADKNVAEWQNWVNVYEGTKDKNKSLLDANKDKITGFQLRSQITNAERSAQSVLSDKMKSPMQKFDELKDQLSSARTSKSELMKQIFGISNDLRDNGASYTQKEIEEKKKKQDELQKQADAQGSIISTIESYMKQIDHQNIKPELGNVQSLGQYGFNMGEKDDAMKRMDDYYRKSIDIQQKIKEEIENGLKMEAIYSS